MDHFERAVAADQQQHHHNEEKRKAKKENAEWANCAVEEYEEEQKWKRKIEMISQKITRKQSDLIFKQMETENEREQKEKLARKVEENNKRNQLTEELLAQNEKEIDQLRQTNEELAKDKKALQSQKELREAIVLTMEENSEKAEGIIKTLTEGLKQAQGTINEKDDFIGQLQEKIRALEASQLQKDQQGAISSPSSENSADIDRPLHIPPSAAENTQHGDVILAQETSMFEQSEKQFDGERPSVEREQSETKAQFIVEKKDETDGTTQTGTSATTAMAPVGGKLKDDEAMVHQERKGPNGTSPNVKLAHHTSGSTTTTTATITPSLVFTNTTPNIGTSLPTTQMDQQKASASSCCPFIKKKKPTKQSSPPYGGDGE